MARPKNNVFNLGPLDRDPDKARHPDRKTKTKSLMTMRQYEEEAKAKGIPICRVIANHLEGDA